MVHQFKALMGTPESIDMKERTMKVVMTTRAMDRDGDIVEPKGLDFQAFMENNVVLWAHNKQVLPIGNVIALSVREDRVEATVKFANTTFGKEVFKLYADGVLKAWSIGFLPTKRKFLEDDEDEEEAKKRIEDGILREYHSRPRFHILEAEVVELSAVPVGSNRESLSKALDDGIEEEELRSCLKAAWSDLGEPKVDAIGERPLMAEWAGNQPVSVKAWAKPSYPNEGAEGYHDCAGIVSLRNGAFKKSIIERGGVGKVPIQLEFVKTAKECGTTMEFEPIRTNVYKAMDGKMDGHEIVEAKVMKIIVKVLDPEVAVTPEESRRGKTTPDESRRADAEGNKDTGGTSELKLLTSEEMWAKEAAHRMALVELEAELLEMDL